MPFYGRHRVYVLFWTWSVGPFVVTQDIEQIQGAKSSGALQRCNIILFPRGVPQLTRYGMRRMARGYLDVLRPNDWAFVFVDPGDGDVPEPLFMGFLDDIRENYSIDASGASRHSISVSASGFEKALHQTSVITDPWIAETINFATLFNIAMRVQAEGTYYPWTTNAIRNIIQSFLDASGTCEWMESSAQKQRVSRSDLELAAIKQLQSEAQDVDEGTPSNTSESTGANPIKALMGQFELPGTNIPLWNFLQLKFENLRERTAISLETMVGLLHQPLSKFIDEWSNPALNVIIYDARRISNDGLSHMTAGFSVQDPTLGGYETKGIREVITAASEVSQSVGQLFNDLAPYIILMRRPLFPNELRALEGPTFSQNDLISLNIGMSDADHYNLAWLEPMLLNTNLYRAATGITGADQDRNRSLESIRRHGLRIYTDQTNCYPDNSGGIPGKLPEMPRNDPAYFREWNQRIQRAGLDQIELLVGSATIPKYVRGLFFGGKIIIGIEPHPGVFAGGSQRVFYVDGLDWRYTARSGEFFTTIALTRGYDTRESWLGGSGTGDIHGQAHPERYGH